jgi:HEAT repeat protein
MPSLRLTLLSCLLGCLLAPPVLAQADLDGDLAVLKGRAVDTTGPGVLAFFKKRTPTPDVAKKIDNLIKQLDDDEPDVREKAMQALAEMGALARGKLADAMKGTDPEVKRRARWALEKIGPAAEDVTLLPAAARVLAARKPEGAAQAAIDFLPHIDNPEAADDVAASLAPLAADKDGKPDPVMLKALSSPHAIVRHAAGQSLAKVAAARESVRKLLKDESVGVRRRVALALLNARDKEAIPVLVALTGSDSDDDAVAAEDALAGLAGEKAPEPADGDDAKARAKVKANWEKWWKEAEPKFDLAKADLDSGTSRWAVMAVQDNRTGMTKLCVLDPKGEVKHTITKNVNYPNHASMSKRDRILVCDQNNARILEIDTAGDIKWNKTFNNPISVHALRNGGTFVATRNQLFFLDRSQKEERRIDRPGYDILAAQAFNDGTTSILTNAGALIRFGKDGKQTSSVTLDLGARRGFVNNLPLFLKDGGVIIPDYFNSQVRAFSKDGKQRWSTRVNNPWSVAPLPSGGFMVATRAGNQLFELDRNGKEKKTTNVADGIPLFYDRR